MTWRTVWRSIGPLLGTGRDDEDRFTGVTRLGVDEYVWHHVATKSVERGGRGPKHLTGMVDLTPDRSRGDPHLLPTKKRVDTAWTCS
jgi:transposase